MIFFLGSGVSLASGLPSVTDISDMLLAGTYFHNPDNKSKFCSLDDLDGRDLEPTTRVQKFLKLLKTVDEQYLVSAAPYFSGSEYKRTGSIYRSMTSYEDLFQMCEQLRQNGAGLTDDAMTGAFVDKIESDAGKLLGGDSLEERLISLYHLSTQASHFIEWVVAQTLHADEIKGLDLLVDLARSPKIDRLDIVTLNHDTLVERLLSEHDISFADGFEAADGDLRSFNEQLFDNTGTKIRVLKPHGSVNWYRVRNDPYPAIFCGEDVENCRLANGERKFIDIKTPAFLSGPGKILTYNRGIFSEIFYRVHQILKEHQSLVMSGYGWGDNAINFRIMNWLGYSDHNAIMLLHQNPDDLVDRSLQLAEVYRSFVAKRRIVLADKWLSETSENEVVDFVERSG